MFLISLPRYVLVFFLSINIEDFLNLCILPKKNKSDDFFDTINSGYSLNSIRSVQVMVSFPTLLFRGQDSEM